MARIRTIKPAFFSSLTNAELPKPTRLTWIGLWTYVDDAGRGVDDPRLVKASIWPLDDDYTTKKIDADLGLLAKAGKIERYKVAGRRYLRVVEWHHQRINRPVPSTLPASPHEDVSTHDKPPNNDGPTHDTSSEYAVSTQCVSSADSRPEGNGREGSRKGMEGKGKEGSGYKSSSSDTVGGVQTSEEEDSSTKVNTAARLVAERRLSVRTGDPLTNATAWLRSVRAEVLRDHGNELATLADQGMHPKAMADRIMPIPSNRYPVAGETREAAWDEAEDAHGKLVAVPRRSA